MRKNADTKASTVSLFCWDFSGTHCFSILLMLDGFFPFQNIKELFSISGRISSVSVFSGQVELISKIQYIWNNYFF